MGGLHDVLRSAKLAEKQSRWNQKRHGLSPAYLHDIDYSNPYKDQHPNKTREVLQKYNLMSPMKLLTLLKLIHLKILVLIPPQQASGVFIVPIH